VPSGPLRVLVVEDSVDDFSLVEHELRRTGLAVDCVRVETADGMRAALGQGQWDVVLSDWSIPGVGGTAALDLLKALGLDLPFIIVSGTADEAQAVAAMRGGAHDYVSKDRLFRLAPAIEREIREHNSRRAHRKSEAARREAERRTRRMIDSAMFGVWSFDAEGKTVFMNQRMADILGLDAEEAGSARLVDFIDEEDRPALAERMAERKAGNAGSYEHKLRRKDGSVVWGALEGTPLYDTEGRFEGVLSVVTDITERRRAWEALREAELRFRRLFESGAVGVTVVDATGRVVEANDAFLEIVGYSRDELTAGELNWVALSPPGWAEASRRAGKDLAASGSCAAFEKEYIRKDGTRVPVLVGLAMLDAKRVLTIVTDLTERKVAEARKAAVVETALDAVIGMDEAGLITEFNPAAERTFGHKRSDALGRSLAELIIPARLRAEHARGLERYIATGHGPVIGKRIELMALHRDGEEFPVELSISRVVQGKNGGFVGFLRDISERRLVETALVEQARVAALGAAVGMALTADVALMDILERCCGAVVQHLGGAFAGIWTLNAASRSLELQASAGKRAALEEAYSRVAVGEFRVGRVAAELRASLSNSVQSEGGADERAWALREGIVAFAGHPLLLGGELVGVVAMFAGDPLTELAHAGLASVADAIAVRVRGKVAEAANAALEEQLRHSQKMEAVGRLAGGVAHDFNNLLSVILSYSEMVIADLKEGDPIRDDIEEIRRAGVRAADLTRQLLMFSRQQVIEPRVLDLNDVIAGMEKMLRRLVGEDVDIAWRPGAVGASVCVDPGSIEQVIMNLAINARDAMPQGGKLTIETANVVVDQSYASAHLGATPGAYVMLSVADSGTGMDKATQARIFEPFFTTKEKGKGTGLGLSTVFGIVHQSGGHVWVESEIGVGSVFKIYLPRVDRRAVEPRPKQSPATLRGHETILLVEDEVQVRDVARGILQRYGYTVIEARDAGEAFLLCERHPATIHLLLTDVVMPQMSGPELAKRLAQERPGMKVLCMSGYTDDAAVRHGVIDSAFAYLQKPLTVETLTRKVRDVLDATGSGG
jgi:PAS domain S-box-containing protein